MSQLTCDVLGMLMNDATMIRHKTKAKKETEQTFKKRWADNNNVSIDKFLMW